MSAREISFSSQSQSHCIINMNASLDDFISDYFGGKFRVKYYDPERENATSMDCSIISEASASLEEDAEVPKSKFSLGEDDLMTSMSGLELEMTLPNDAEESLENELNESQTKIFVIKASRRSMSYDIVFNPLRTSGDSMQIRLETDKQSPQSQSNSPGENNKYKLLQENVRKLKAEVIKLKFINKKLEGQVQSLKTELGNAEKNAQNLEHQLNNFRR